jgi:hypothetical protein
MPDAVKVVTSTSKPDAVKEVATDTTSKPDTVKEVATDTTSKPDAVKEVTTVTTKDFIEFDYPFIGGPLIE